MVGKCAHLFHPRVKQGCASMMFLASHVSFPCRTWLMRLSRRRLVGDGTPVTESCWLFFWNRGSGERGLDTHTRPTLLASPQCDSFPLLLR